MGLVDEEEEEEKKKDKKWARRIRIILKTKNKVLCIWLFKCF